jgi:tRNA pseudouridine55 synthase
VPPSGVLIIDKPAGPTSHDVVATVRRALATREVGHAGTLDPAASGVLVVAIGEATKLAGYLSGQDKSYEACVAFGRSTTTLDAEGETTDESPVPARLLHGLGAAIDAERARCEQIPPAFSAIQTGGRRAYERARRGQLVELAPRSVQVRRIDVLATTPGSVTLSLTVSKGYYVRALARDLGAALGVPAHLCALRRTRSGSFALAEAVPPSAPATELLRALVPLAVAAARVLPVASLTREGIAHAVHGRPLEASCFASAAPTGRAAWLGPDGSLVAIGSPHPAKGFAVERGFRQDTSSEPI